MNRKELVLKLSEFFEVTPKYLGVPTFAYEITTEGETFTIDRQGSIKNSKGEEMTLEAILNAEKHESESETEVPEKTDELLIDGFEVEFPFEGHSGTTLLNIVNMLSSKQKLIARAFGLNEALLDEDFAEELSHKETSTIEDFKTAFLEAGLERCKGLTFDFEKETLTFKLVDGKLNQDKITAFKDLAVLINNNAKMLKHASFKTVQEENPKYAFRTWLIRLGMNGDEYKTSRKTLIAGLEGSSAFRKPREETDKA